MENMIGKASPSENYCPPESIDVLWPDTDYPIGHKDRAWGRMTIIGNRESAISSIETSLASGSISKSEAEIIKSSLPMGKEIFDPRMMSILPIGK